MRLNVENGGGEIVVPELLYISTFLYIFTFGLSILSQVAMSI